MAPNIHNSIPIQINGSESAEWYLANTSGEDFQLAWLEYHRYAYETSQDPLQVYAIRQTFNSRGVYQFIIQDANEEHGFPGYEIVQFRRTNVNQKSPEREWKPGIEVPAHVREWLGTEWYMEGWNTRIGIAVGEYAEWLDIPWFIANNGDQFTIHDKLTRKWIREQPEIVTRWTMCFSGEVYYKRRRKLSAIERDVRRFARTNIDLILGNIF